MVIIKARLTFFIVIFCSICSNDFLLAKKVAHDGESVKKLVATWLDVGDKQKGALVELSIMRNRGELKDLPLKKDIFESLITNSKNIFFLYDSIAFLASFSKDDELLRHCKLNITHKVRTQNILIASLTYVSVYDEQAFEQYFSKKEYLQIQEEIRTLFAWHPVMMQKRDQFLIDALLRKPKMEPISSKEHVRKIIADDSDPVYLLLLKEEAFITDFVNRNKKLLMTPTLPLQLQELLGEIHSFESFDILLENYLQEQNFRSAITLASCIGSLQIE